MTKGGRSAVELKAGTDCGVSSLGYLSVFRLRCPLSRVKAVENVIVKTMFRREKLMDAAVS